MKVSRAIMAAAVLAIVSVPDVYADKTGTKVAVQIDSGFKPELKEPGGGASSKREKNMQARAGVWSYLEVPVTVFAAEPNPRSRDDGKALRAIPHGTIDELEVRFYLALSDPALNDYKPSELSRDDAKKLIVLERTVKYTDVPVNENKEQSQKTPAKVGVFISPVTASKLTGGRPEKLKEKLVALAVEFYYGGSVCRLAQPRRTANPKEKNHVNYCWDASRKEAFSKLWWKMTSSQLPRSQDYRLLSIAETPFAPQYGNFHFPPTVPLYGSEAAPRAASSSPLGTPEPAASDRAADKDAKAGAKESASAADSAGES